MAAYLRFLLAAARGEGGSLLSAASARRLVTPTIDAPVFGHGARYGCGVATVPIGGAPCLHHTGGMLSFTSSFHADPAAGVAAFASVNASLNNDYRPRLITAHAIQLMRAARRGEALPPIGDLARLPMVSEPHRLAGHFLAADGRAIAITLGEGGPRLIADRREGRLQPAGDDALVTDHPSFETAGFDIVRAHDAVTGLWWRDTLFARGAPARPPAVSDRLRPLTGRYASSDPWAGTVALYARGDMLVSEGGSVLIDRGGYWSTTDDEGGVERLRLDAPIAGRPSRANISGTDLNRVALG
jgi:hypothetical protein